MVWLLLLGISAYAQGDVRLELGFAGEIVADAWNPLRLTLRDGPEAELTMLIDRGNLRDGEQVVRYTARLETQGGLSVFEDDLYIPAWRSFTWSVRTPERVLASGSFDRRSVDPRPLQLVSADRPGEWRSLFGDEARVTEVLASELPERVAAYAGVETLLLDGSASPPRPEAVVAAGAAGAVVVLAEPLPNPFETLVTLSERSQRLGTGWLVREEAEDVSAVLASTPRLDGAALAEALLTPELLELPPGPPPLTLLLILGGYGLLTLLLIRFGGPPGFLASVSLALLVSLAAWSALRPPAATLTRGRSLSLGAGGLAQVHELRSLLQFPAGEVTVPVSAHPLGSGAYSQAPDGVRLAMPRWSRATLLVRPRLEPARLVWRGRNLQNLGDRLLTDVYVLGLGRQASLPPDGTLEMSAGTHNDLPRVYDALLPLLPSGSALASENGRIHVALPEYDPRLAGP